MLVNKSLDHVNQNNPFDIRFRSISILIIAMKFIAFIIPLILKHYITIENNSKHNTKTTITEYITST